MVTNAGINDASKLQAELTRLRAEVERLNGAISFVRSRSQRASEILNEYDATHRAALAAGGNGE